MSYSPLVPIALFGWLPAGLLLAAWLGPRRGVLAIVVLGWLLLPNAVYKEASLPAYTKVTAVAVSALLAVCFFSSRWFLTFRPRLLDAPMLVWCLSPSASVLANGLPLNEALLVLAEQLTTWGLPYFFGRLSFDSHESLKDLALAIVIGGIVYVPLCLYEVKMSPVLHSSVYGFYQHAGFDQARRFGGWRPTVFLQHGLAVGLYMCGAALVATWTWRRDVAAALMRVRMSYIAIALLVMAILCKSVGSIVLLVAGICLLWVARRTRSHLPLYALLLAAPVYMALRAPGLWSGESMIEAVRTFTEERASSLESRVRSEDVLTVHALKQPLFGWGGMGRNCVWDASGRQLAIYDALWTIVFGKYGLIGLGAMTSAMLLPVLVSISRSPKTEFASRALYAPAACLGVLVASFLIDCLFNAMVNPLYPLIVGALASVASARKYPIATVWRKRIPANSPLPSRSGAGISRAGK